MMKHWSFYYPQSGHFSGRTFSATDESALVINTPEGLAAMEGQHDHLCCRVDIATGLLMDYQPPAPNADHEWDETAKRWKLTATAQQRATEQAAARARIAQLESSQHRPHRELSLDPTNVEARQRLQALEDEISLLRQKLGELPMSNNAIRTP